MSNEESNVINLDAQRQAAQAYNVQGVLNTVRSIARRSLDKLLGVSHNGKRDIYDIYGYPDDLGGSVGFEFMYRYASRQGVSNRITYGVAHSCWRDGFEVRLDPDDEDSVQLDEELRELNRRGLTRKLEAVDVLGRIGRFSVLYVGLPDGKQPDEEAGSVPATRLKDVYFQPYAYDSVEISAYESDPKSPRYGLPVLYELFRITRRSNEKDRGRLQSMRVHWSRVVHIAEGALDSDIEGLGALEPVFNRLLDLDKTCGGSSEAYFRNARRVIAYEIEKEFAQSLIGDTTAKEAFDTAVEKFTNEWQDQITLTGAKANSLQVEHQSPKDTVLVALWEISGYTGIPIRILTGEGAGQLAGSEDQLAYNNLIADRQRLHCAAMVEGVLQVFARAGMLGYDPQWAVVFPPQQASTELQRAEVGYKRAQSVDVVARALSTAGGAEFDAESVLRACELSDIEVMALDDLPPLPDSKDET